MGMECGAFICYGYKISKGNLVQGINNLWPELELHDESSEDDAVAQLQGYLKKDNQLDLSFIGYNENITHYVIRVRDSIKTTGRFWVDAMDVQERRFFPEWTTLFNNLFSAMKLSYSSSDIGWRLEWCFWR